MARPVAEHHQQAGGDEQFRAAGARDAAEQRAQHEAAGDDQAETTSDRLADGPGERTLSAALDAEHADDEQHRHRGDVLEQQHARARRGRPAPPARFSLRQDLHDDGGGGHRQRGAGDGGDAGGAPSA